MEPNEVHQTICAQLDSMLPADLTPGKDVGMAPLRGDTLLVRVLPSEPNDERSLDAHVTYLPGPDLYSVVIFQRGERRELEQVYCDQLGELVFGEHAKPFGLPMGGLIVMDEAGNIVKEETW